MGYLAGTLVIAGLPVAVVWHRDGQEWSRLLSKLACGVCIVVGMLAAQRQLPLGPWLDTAWALVFLLAWLTIVRREARVVMRLLRPLRGLR